MRILILGAGKMGSFFTDLLSFNHEVAVLETDARRMRFIYNALRFTSYEEIDGFAPELVINCVTLSRTLDAFRAAFPFLPDSCIISDIASVKTGLREFYGECGFRYVSVHPMFGPTFANLGNLQTENAIIIDEPDSKDTGYVNNCSGKGMPGGCEVNGVNGINGAARTDGINSADSADRPDGTRAKKVLRGTDYMGKIFFRDLFASLKLNVCEYTFEEHDRVVAYSLSIPFASTLVFGAIMKHQDAPGTTFKKHLAIARGLLSEDDYLLTEILFNPNTAGQLSRIIETLNKLADIVEKKDSVRMKFFLDMVRENVTG